MMMVTTAAGSRHRPPPPLRYSPVFVDVWNGSMWFVSESNAVRGSRGRSRDRRERQRRPPLPFQREPVVGERARERGGLQRRRRPKHALTNTNDTQQRVPNQSIRSGHALPFNEPASTLMCPPSNRPARGAEDSASLGPLPHPAREGTPAGTRRPTILLLPPRRLDPCSGSWRSSWRPPRWPRPSSSPTVRGRVLCVLPRESLVRDRMIACCVCRINRSSGPIRRPGLVP